MDRRAITIRTLGFATAALLVVGGYLTLAWIQARVEPYRPWIIRELFHLTGLPVILRGITVSPWTGMTVNLEHLEIHSPDPSLPPLFLADEIHLGMSWQFWLQDRPIISTITLVRPQINLTQTAGHPWYQRVQDLAHLGDRQLIRRLGIGLTELSIDEITIQNGLITVNDWEERAKPTWVIERLSGKLHRVAPHLPSALSLSARWQETLWSLNGQLGPLPDGLSLEELPILLSLEARFSLVDRWLALFDLAGRKVETSRGYATAMIHGSLKEGLQTDTWGQVEQLRWRDPHYRSPAMDLSWRQKLTIALVDGRLVLRIREGFFHLDGQPLLEIKGDWQGSAANRYHWELNTLRPFPLSHLPPPPGGWSLTGPLEGGLVVDGHWPYQVTLNLTADADRLVVTHPPSGLHKGDRTPLQLEGRWQWQDDGPHLVQLTAKNRTVEGALVTLWGGGAAGGVARLQGSWPLEDLANYWPTLASWPMRGLAQIEALRPGDAGHPWEAVGRVTVGAGTFFDLPFAGAEAAFHRREGLLTIPWLRARAGGGAIEADLTLAGAESPRLDGRFTLLGVVVPVWPAQGELRVEGVLSGQGEFQGLLNPERTALAQWQGGASLELSPGRLVNVDPVALTAPVGDQPAPLLHPDRSLYWSKAQATLRRSLAGLLELDEVSVEGYAFRLNGRGQLGVTDPYLAITGHTDWHPDPFSYWLAMDGGKWWVMAPDCGQWSNRCP